MKAPHCGMKFDIDEFLYTIPLDADANADLNAEWLTRADL